MVWFVCFKSELGCFLVSPSKGFLSQLLALERELSSQVNSGKSRVKHVVRFECSTEARAPLLRPYWMMNGTNLVLATCWNQSVRNGVWSKMRLISVI